MLREQEIIQLTEKTLKRQGLNPKDFRNEFQYQQAIRREEGYKFSLSDYASGLIFSQLSAQRSWSQINELSSEIENIFLNFDFDKLKELAKKPIVLVNKLKKIKAGNIMIKSQMNNLAFNLNKLEKIYDRIENDCPRKMTFEQCKLYSKKYISSLSDYNSPLKLKYIGHALAAEFLKNIGIPVVKVDVHIIRILGKERLEILSFKSDKPTKNEISIAIDEFCDFVKRNSSHVADVIYFDALFWSLGARKYGEICTAKPKCNLCLLKYLCNFSK